MSVRFVFLMLYACLSISTGGPIGNANTCVDPSEIESRLADIEASDHLSIILPTPVLKKLDSVEKMNRVRVSGEDDTTFMPSVSEQLLLGNKTCPDVLAPSADDAEIEDRSMCPFYYVISHDPNRYPRFLAEARCKCMGCLDDRSGKHQCEPIYFARKILRRTKCIDGVYEYVPEVLKVQNGCTCAQRRIVQSEPAKDTSSTPKLTTTGVPFI